MGFLSVFRDLSRSTSPARPTGEKRTLDDRTVASFFCHGRADSDATIQLAQEMRLEVREHLQSQQSEHLPFAENTPLTPMHIDTFPGSRVLSKADDINDFNGQPPRLQSLDHGLDLMNSVLAETGGHVDLGSVPLFFSKLPAELRNHIYHLALIPDEAVYVSGAAPPRVPSLLQTCRQIRREASGIYYSNTVFTHHFQTHLWRTVFNGPLIDWLKSIGAEACFQLRNLTLTHRIIDATEQDFSAFDSFVKVTGSVEMDCREYMKDLAALSVVVKEVKVEPAKDARRRKRIATAGHDAPWVKALEEAKRAY